MKKNFLPYLASFCLLAAPTASTSAEAAVSGVHTYADHSVLASGQWVKVALDGTSDGVYQIPYSQLRQMGFSRPEMVGVYGFGGHLLDEAFAHNHQDDLPEIAVFHDREKQRILFYGQGTIKWSYDNKRQTFTHRQNPYSTQAVYFLHQKEDAPRQMEAVPSANATSALTLTHFDEHLLHESEITNIGKTGREFYGESFLFTQTQDFSFAALDTGIIQLDINFIACSSSTSSFSVRLDGQDVGSASIYAKGSDYAFASESTFSKAIHSSRNNGSTIRITYNKGTGSPSAAHLNYIRMQGKSRIGLPTAGTAYQLFRSKEAESQIVTYDIEKYSIQQQVWDVTSPADIRLQQLAESGSSFTAQGKGIREYALVNLTSNNFKGVKNLGNINNQDLHSLAPTDMVIVTAKAFRTQAERLADFRRSNDHLSVTVVTPEEIYNEFSSGRPDATAIRLFLKMFYDRGDQLKYLLLFGDGNYNNRRYANSAYYLPTYESESSLVETASCVCDDYFGFLDDNEGGRTDSNGRYILTYDVLDIGIGRLPVHTTAEAEAVVQKIIGYSQNRNYGTWKNRLCFLSDDDKISANASDSPNAHMKHNDQLIESLTRAGHNEFVYKKIYLPSYAQTTSASSTDYPDAKKEFLETLQQGALLVNYAGHGSTSAITNENLMTTAIASSLNMKYLPVWITATCDISRFDDDDTSCGEALLLNPNGGAEALFTTTRVVYAQQNLKLNQAIINHIFSRKADGTRYRLGDVMKAAKVSLGSDYNKLNFCLLGDPSTTLAYPEQEMEITAINGISTIGSDTIFSLPALSRVTMRGRLLQNGTQLTDTTFNGLIYPTVYDAADTLIADKGLYQEPVFSFTNRSKKVFSGRDLIHKGEFEFSFIMPQDIAFSLDNGLVNLYACSDDGKEAQGYFDRINITGSKSPLDADTIGPDIHALFLNQRDFRSGDVVNATPYFYAEVSDSSGFNATGNSIGHDVSLIIQCTSNPLLATRQLILNNYFTTFTGDSHRGKVACSIPALEEGDYVATFRIWDVYNNATTARFAFTVNQSRAPQTVIAQAYPSPVKQGEDVTFRILHNRPESADEMHIQVFSQTGAKMYDATVSNTSSEVVYQRADAQSATDLDQSLRADENSILMGCSTHVWKADVAPGIYIYKVYLSSNGSDATSKSKLIMVK